MKLHFRVLGDGQPLIVLHGLFGLSDNWNTLAKGYAENGFRVYLPDQRNHGRSPHHPEFNYTVMAADLQELIASQNIHQPDLIGHSMGGKTVMFHAVQFPNVSRKLVVADIAPRYYPPHHHAVLAALRSVRIEEIVSRREAEQALRDSLSDEGTVQFLLKNLFWKEDGKLDWRFNLDAIEQNIERVGEALPAGISVEQPSLFLRGEKSGYINSSDEAEIRSRFTQSQVLTIASAGHWVHAEQPQAFLEATLRFLGQ